MRNLIFCALLLAAGGVFGQTDYDYSFYAPGAVRAFPAAHDTVRSPAIYHISKMGATVTIAPIDNPSQFVYSGRVGFQGVVQTNQALIYNGVEGSRLIVQPLFGCVVLITGPDAQKAGSQTPDKCTYNIIGGCSYDANAGTGVDPDK